MVVDVISYLNNWTVRKKIRPPNYAIVNDTVEKGVISFKAELRIATIDYVSIAEANTKRNAKCKAAQAMIKYMYEEKRLITIDDIQQIADYDQFIRVNNTVGSSKDETESCINEHTIGTSKNKKNRRKRKVAAAVVSTVKKIRVVEPEVITIDDNEAEDDDDEEDAIVFVGSEKLLQSTTTAHNYSKDLSRKFELPKSRLPNCRNADTEKTMPKRWLPKGADTNLMVECDEMRSDKQLGLIRTIDCNEDNIGWQESATTSRIVQLSTDITMPPSLSSIIAKRVRSIRNQFPTHFERLDADIWDHYLRNQQDADTFVWKDNIRKVLFDLVEEVCFTKLSTMLYNISQVVPNCRLYTVGSTINGCGSYNSDMDLCLVVADKFVGLRTDRIYAVHLLTTVMKHLRSNRGRFLHHRVGRIELIPAKVPILKLAVKEPNKTDILEIDINCNNVAGIYNSHLLHYYARLDQRFPALCLLIKHWAIANDINDAMTGTLNSYSLILLVLHYLQCAVSPIVLPNLQALFPTFFNDIHFEQILLFRDLPGPLPHPSNNRQTVGELLIGFFDYYAQFDFDHFAISVRDACVINRSTLETTTNHFKMFIEEPYDRGNTARCVTRPEKMQQIVDALEMARCALMDTRKPPIIENINVKL